MMDAMDEAVVLGNYQTTSMEESKDPSLTSVPRLNTEEGEQEERTSLRPPLESQEDDDVGGGEKEEGDGADVGE